MWAASPRADVEAVRFGEPARVALCRSEEHRHLVADCELTTGDDDALLQHPSFEQLERCVVPEELLHGDLGRHVTGGEAAPLVATVHERSQTVAERIDGGLVSSFEEDHGGRDDLGHAQRVAVVFDLAQGRDQERVGGASLLGDEGLGVRDVLGGRPVGRHSDLVGRRQLVHLDDGVGPLEEELRVGARDSEHRADDGNGVRLGVVGQQVEGCRVGALVEQLGREPLDRRSQGSHRSRREHLRDEPAEARVVWRFEAQERPLLVLMEGRPAPVGLGATHLGVGVPVGVPTAQAPVPEGVMDVVEPGEGPLSRQRVLEAGCGLPEGGQRRVGVGDEGRVVDIETGQGVVELGHPADRSEAPCPQSRAGTPTVSRAPVPGSELAWTVPPMAVMSSRTIANPRPEPFSFISGRDPTTYRRSKT